VEKKVASTVDSELSGFSESSTGHVLGDTRVVASVGQSHLTDEEVAFVRDDEIDVCVRINRFFVFQPVHLQLHQRHTP